VRKRELKIFSLFSNTGMAVRNYKVSFYVSSRKRVAKEHNVFRQLYDME